ncbi:hypothetical protein GW17_00061213, partial [Ensete ventricosum]
VNVATNAQFDPCHKMRPQFQSRAPWLTCLLQPSRLEILHRHAAFRRCGSVFIRPTSVTSERPPLALRCI